jgi:hypothetical protein
MESKRIPETLKIVGLSPCATMINKTLIKQNFQNRVATRVGFTHRCARSQCYRSFAWALEHCCA